MSREATALLIDNTPGLGARAARALAAADTRALGLRLVIGANLAAHGLARVAHIPAFASTLVADFTGVLPAFLVRPFAYAVPPLELAIGVLVLFGVRLREALLAASALLAALTFGTCLLARWESAGLQIVYALAYWALASSLEGRARQAP